MATIRTSIQIQDRMSIAFQSMNTAMGTVLNSFEALNTASGQAIDTTAIRAARNDLAQAGMLFNEIEQEINQSNQSQHRFNNEIRAGTSAADGLLKKVMGIAAAYLSVRTGGNIIALSDEMTNTAARLDMVNGQYQDMMADMNNLQASANLDLNVNAPSIDTSNFDATIQQMDTDLNSLNTTTSVDLSVAASNVDTSNFDATIQQMNADLNNLNTSTTVDLSVAVSNVDTANLDAMTSQIDTKLNNLNASANIDLNVTAPTIDIANISNQINGIPIVADISMNSAVSGVEAMNSNLQTTEQLQQKIFDSAQRSYGSYQDTAALVGKLGLNARDAFSSTDEIVGFSELLNKQFGIAGTNAEGVKNATLQLTQALGGGVLRGQELNSIFEHAPNIIQTIADYLDVPIGKIREMAGDGQISAEVVKNAMFAAADGINERFDSMPVTFEQLWTSFKNEALWAFQPVLQGINDIANNEKFQSLIDNTVNSLYVLSAVTMGALDLITATAGAVYDGWSIIEPVIWGVVAALLVYNSTMGIAWLTTLKNVVAKGAHALASWAETAAIIGLIIAQDGLNAAMAACPITWIIIGIIAIIAIFYAAVAAVNHFAGTTASATGIIVGVIMAALAFIGNIFIAAGNLIIDVVALIWNNIASFAEFFANVFNDPVGSVVRLFASMADSTLAILESIASAIDTLFGSNLASAVSGWRDSLSATVMQVYGEAAIKIPRMDASALHFDRFEYGKAYNVGYNFGENLEKKFSLGGMLDNLAGASVEPSAFDFASADPADMKNKADTAKNTARMAKSMEASEEDLKYLRDLAERDVINRFTTAEINIDARSENHINSEMDIDGIIDRMGEKVEEVAQKIAEGDDDYV